MATPVGAPVPPAKDADMQFSYIKAYFNSSSGTANAEYKSRCKDPNAPNAICKVPDQTTPPDPGRATTFLSPNKGLPGDNPLATADEPTAGTAASTACGAAEESLA